MTTELATVDPAWENFLGASLAYMAGTEEDRPSYVSALRLALRAPMPARAVQVGMGRQDLIEAILDYARGSQFPQNPRTKPGLDPLPLPAWSELVEVWA